MEWSEGGGKWDNCNSIINKYIKKIKQTTKKKKERGKTLGEPVPWTRVIQFVVMNSF